MDVGRLMIAAIVDMRAVAGASVMLLLNLLFFAPAQAAPAKQIVSLAPNLTEIAFAAGAGSRIVATVEFSDYPEAAKKIPRIGDAFRFDYERILALQPDAVLAWEPGTPAEVVERLRALKLRVVTIRTQHLQDIAVAVREIGRIAGTESAANPVADDFERGIGKLRAEYGRREIVDVFLQINDQPLYTVNGRQIMSELVEICGGRNVFGALNDLAPQVGVEAVIAANPGAIISTGAADSPGYTQWQRWRQMRAVSAGNLFLLPPEEIARSTPRLIAGGQKMCRTLQTARERLSRSN
jgi:iron complex transport system substrate-binding protein